MANSSCYLVYFFLLLLQQLASGAVQLFLLIDRKSSIDPFDPSGDQPQLETGEIELDNITFAYPTRPGVAVLDGFSLKVPAGKTTALVVSFLDMQSFTGETLTFLCNRVKAVPARARLSV
jgi:ABC-type multidrug transport system fused ATPase/permease subunit